MQEVAAGFSLGPEAASGAGVEGNQPFGGTLFKGFAVHVAQHQDLARAGILDDGRQQAALILAQIKIVKNHRIG